MSEDRTAVCCTAAAQISLFLGGQPYQKSYAKTGRAEIDRLCPTGGRLGTCRLTPKFRQNLQELKPAANQVRRCHGVPNIKEDIDIFEFCRDAVDAITEMTRSNGKEIESVRQRLRRRLMLARDLLKVLGGESLDKLELASMQDAAN